MEHGKGKTLNVYTDSRYAYAILRPHGAVWKKRGMFTTENKQVKHGLNTLRLLEAVQLLNKVAVMHSKGHHEGNAEIIKGKNKADETVKSVALKLVT